MCARQKNNGSVKKHSSGFTLVELMIVVVVVAVLMGIALPAYQQQVIRGKRAAASAEMLHIANLQQQYLLSNRSYMDAAILSTAGYALDADVAKNYTVTITLGTAAVPSYTMRFSPVGRQAVDGGLELNSEGVYTYEFAGKWDR